MARLRGRRKDAAFEALVAEHADAVWRFAMTMLRQPDDADDVTQETFVRVHSALDTFRGDAAVRTWILAICRNACLDVLRRRRPDTLPLDHLETNPAAGAADDHATAVTARTVLAEAAAELPDDEREAFALVDVLGYSGEEAAEICQVPATTLRSRRHRAHARLVDRLTEAAS